MADREKILLAALAEISHFPIFHDFDQPLLRQLCQAGEIIFSPEQDVVFRCGEDANYFGIVMSGAYKLSRLSPQGDEAIVHFSTTGDVVGAFIMARAQPRYPVNLVAMAPSRFLKIPRENYLQCWQQQPELTLRIQNYLVTRIGQMHSQLVHNKAPVSAKVASLLLALLHRQGSARELTLGLPLTRREIADSLGISIGSVIRVMSLWSKHGILQTTDQHIRILQLDKLIEQIKRC